MRLSKKIITEAMTIGSDGKLSGQSNLNMLRSKVPGCNVIADDHDELSFSVEDSSKRKWTTIWNKAENEIRLVSQSNQEYLYGQPVESIEDVIQAATSDDSSMWKMVK